MPSRDIYLGVGLEGKGKAEVVGASVFEAS